MSEAPRFRHAVVFALAAGDVPWLAGAVLLGGVLGPVLLLGLRATPASSAALVGFAG